MYLIYILCATQMYKYAVNGLRLQANVASDVLTQIEQERTCRKPKVYMQCMLNKETKKPRNKERHPLKSKRPCLQHWPNSCWINAFKKHHFYAKCKKM